MSNIRRLSSPAASRPRMPKDYGIVGETEGSGLLPWSHANERLGSSRNYWVHTARPDGRPHVEPVWGLWLEEHFYFSTSQNSVAGRNISSNPMVAVHLESGDDVVILEGKAHKVTDRALLSRLDDAYFTKYSYHLVQGESGSVYVLHHEVAFSWLERDFVGSATKYGF